MPDHILRRKEADERWRDPSRREELWSSYQSPLGVTNKDARQYTWFPDPLVRREEKEEQEEPDYDFLEGVVCYNCYAEGHLAKHCRNPTVDTTFSLRLKSCEGHAASSTGWDHSTKQVFYTGGKSGGRCERCPVDKGCCAVTNQWNVRA